MFNLSMLNYDYLDKLSNEELIRIYNELKEFDYEYANFVIDYIFDKNKDFIYKSVNKIISNYGLLSKYGFSKEENETDISQEGFIAFKESIDKFDLSKNILFTTFAYDQMSYKILDFISHDKIISSSEYFIKLQVKIKKISSELEFILQRNPTPEEIRDELISKTSYKHVSTNTIINALSTDLDASSDTNLINSKSSLLTGNDPNNNLLVSLEEFLLEFKNTVINALAQRAEDCGISQG